MMLCSSFLHLRWYSGAVCLLSLGFLALITTGCQSILLAPTSIPSATPELVTPILSLEQATIETAWANSPHANTYNLEKGPNTYCARCHSPENWDSTAKIDSPPNCLSCKFPNESQVRIASSNSLVSQEDWKNIGCEICHNVQDGVVSAQTAWLDIETGYHEATSQPDQLCTKCHMDTATLKHGIDLGNQVHKGFSCINCHEPHSTTASCVSSGCHADLKNVSVDKTSPVYHSNIHAMVNCVACHDASGMDILNPEGGTNWTTYRTVQSVQGPVSEIYSSHNLQRTVNCQKCHFSGNPYGLPDSANP